METKKDFTHTLQHLDAGLLHEKLSTILGKIAVAVVANGKQGSLDLKLTLKPISDNGQIHIDHKITASRPTSRGKVVEEDTTSTSMYAHSNGDVTVTSEKQGDIFEKQSA